MQALRQLNKDNKISLQCVRYDAYNDLQCQEITEQKLFEENASKPMMCSIDFL